MSSAALQSPTSYGLPEFPLNLELDPPSPVKVREWVAELFEQNHLSLASALAEAGLAARVTEVVEDKKRGLVARIATTGTVDDAALAALLGQYPPAWERMG